MALGLPIIATYNPYWPIDIEKEQIGINIITNSPMEWKNAIDFLLKNPNKAKKWVLKLGNLLKENGILKVQNSAY